MNYKNLIADNQDVPFTGGRILTDLEKFRIFIEDDFKSVIGDVFYLKDKSKISLTKILMKLKKLKKEEATIFLLLNTSKRFLMIKELINKESNIDFGLFGILLYLSLTCFDSLGQKNEFKTFQDWLNSRNNEGIKELQEKINSNEKIILRTNIYDLYEKKYKPEFGAKK